MSDYNSPITCAFHPKRETQLRCNRCDKPICIKCATHTPTGYRCPECIRSQQKIFITTKWFDYITAAVIAGIISFLASWLSIFLSFGLLYTVIIAIGAGFLVIWTVKKAIRNRKSPLLRIVMSSSAFLFSLLPLFLYHVTVLLDINDPTFPLDAFLYSLIWDLAFTVIITLYIFIQQRK